jgi:hypothetical protein
MWFASMENLVYRFWKQCGEYGRKEILSTNVQKLFNGLVVCVMERMMNWWLFYTNVTSQEL